MLIKAIPQQESPLVQLALAEAMMKLQEKDSADEWRKLLSSDHVEVDVRHNLEETLETILY
jgi:Tfp pilus assembly protein PilF